MKVSKMTLFTVAIIFCGVFHIAFTADHGEACSLRSQIANFFRSNGSAQGCISGKGLVCMSHKCVCADPTNVYELPEPVGSNMGTDISNVASKAGNFLSNLFRGSTTTTSTTVSPPVSGGGTMTGGKCVGRAGSPCFTQNSTCVKNAVCKGTPRICKCQGIYGSNASGMCSKTSNVVNQVIKQTVG